MTAVDYITSLRQRREAIVNQHAEAPTREYRDRYRTMATSFGFEGHMKWAEAMP
jgi:hypothetical protein